MVRINLIAPRLLADQHLVAEYDEILMLFGYVRKYPKVQAKSIPTSYRLGKGHVLFFKNKLLYLKKRHERLKEEMHARGFRTNKTISLKDFPASLCNDWKPKAADLKIIKKRISEKLSKKPNYYRWHGKPRN